MLLDASSQEGVLGSCGEAATSAYAVTMPKTFVPKPAKVIRIRQEKRNVIATGETSKRFIMAIGNQRVAFDFLTRVTELPPATGNQPAVAPMKKRQDPQPIRQQGKRAADRSPQTDRS